MPTTSDILASAESALRAALINHAAIANVLGEKDIYYYTVSRSDGDLVCEFHHEHKGVMVNGGSL